jgi:hypothetical protein
MLDKYSVMCVGLHWLGIESTCRLLVLANI